MSPVQWLAVVLGLLLWTSGWLLYGAYLGWHLTAQRHYDCGYADGVAGTYRTPSRTDLDCGPTRVRTVERV